MAANYARIVIPCNLQVMFNILNSKKRNCWAFSIANDASTHYGKSYFDNRIRIHLDGKLHNIHALAIPMFEHHTGENMFLLVSRFLDVVCPHWRMQLLGIGSDGASSMVGHLQGVVTRLVNASPHSVYRVWCGLHQLDLVLKHSYAMLWDNDVVTIMKKFINHLRQQPALITEMKCQCPQLSTCWLVMGTVSTWFLVKRIQIFEYINAAETAVEEAPPVWWWIIIAGISALTDIINPVFVKLQAQNLLVSTQSMMLEGLGINICTAVGVDGPFTNDEIRAMPQRFRCTHGRWSVSYENIVSFLQGLGMYTRHALQCLPDEIHHKVVRSVGELAVHLVEGIVNIQAERSDRNNAADDLPPVLPHELVKIPPGVYGATVIDPHILQLRHSWTEHDIGEIETEHRQLHIAYREEPALKSALDSYENTGITSFETGWAIVEGRFDILRDFCGGIATVFANTASVESDFSIVGCEKDVYRLSLTDLSLEGIMQCKQFELLSLLA